MQADVTMTLSELRRIMFAYLRLQAGYEPRVINVVFSEDDSRQMLEIKQLSVAVLEIGFLAESA